MRAMLRDARARVMAAVWVAAVCAAAQLASAAVAASDASAPKPHAVLAPLSAPSAASHLPVHYFVLIDAGSTGSRAHVHEYRVEAARPLPLVEESRNKKIKPGLSSYAANPANARTSIEDLLEFIRDTVPKEHWATTPLHLQATAGLRSVTPAEASAILDVVRDALSASGFRFERSWARIISGEQEGINGWMAVNYLLGVFDKPHVGPAGSTPSTTGVVEMGGSSMQITFAPRTVAEDERKHLNEVRVAGTSFWLYTHSFLQYGLQAAEKLYQRLAVDSIEEAGNPCYPPKLRHSSTGDFTKCTELLSAVIDKSKQCPASSCSFNGVYQPRITEENQFLAIENFYYTAKFFGSATQQDYAGPPSENALPAPESGDAAPPAGGGNEFIEALRAKGKEFCNQEWSSLVTSYASTPKEELRTFCFSAAYQSVMLETGLGFSSRGSNLRVARTIRNKGIDWEMGATLFELMPKDPSPAATTRTADAVVDVDTGIVQPVMVRPGESELLPGGGSVSTHTSPFCARCALWTFLIAIALVCVYLSWTRYCNSKSGRAGATLAPSYSQSAFNRV